MPASSGYFSSFFSSSSENSPVPPPSVQHCLPEAPPPTFFVTDRRLLKHKCEWDPEHIDGPDRLKAIHDELEKNRVLAQCQILEPAECSQEDLRLVHSQEHIDSIREASALPDLEQMEHFCAGREDIYVNSHSWECALLSAGCAIKAMESVVNASRAAAERIDADQPPPPAPNAFAAIRPPGHHASQNDPCGFCLFNNVAICAKKARAMGLQRVLIVDWDVHAGQGTQYSVEGDTGILLVSIHRYESGQFWPELPESGIMNKYKNTINIPLNEVGYGDAEYAAMMHLLVLPLIQQWKPELILVSCGFDAGLGDPQGEMEVSPAGFGYMTGLLARTGIPLCMVLEGGYFLHSVVKGTLYCMRALLQRAPPMVNFSQRPPAPLFLRTLYTVLLSRTNDKQLKLPLFRHFTDQLNSLRLGLLGSPDRRKRRELSPIQLPDGHDDYLGNRKPAELAMAAHTYPTRGEYPAREPAVERHFALRLQQLMDQYAKGPPERAPLDIELGPGGRVLIPARHGPENGASKKELIRLDSAEQLLLFYFYLLLPMDFTFFDVSLSSMKLPLTGQQLHGLVARLEKETLPAAVMNGGVDGTTKKCHHWLDLDRILDRFAQMKPFFLFQSSA